MSRIHQAFERIRAERQAALGTNGRSKIRAEASDRFKDNSKSSDQGLPSIPMAEQRQAIVSLDDFEKCFEPLEPSKMNGGRHAIVETTRQLKIQPETSGFKGNDSEPSSQVLSGSVKGRAKRDLLGVVFEGGTTSTIGKPSRSALPIIPKTGTDQAPNKNGARAPFPLFSRDLAIRPDPKLVAIVAPKANVSEQYRTLRAKILQTQREKGLKTLLVASAGASEGKTLTAINLALTMAQEIDLKILIVDGDLRRPSLHRYLGTPNALGISDYLSRNCPLESILCNTSLPNFFVATAGTVAEKPAELLNSSRMDDFLSYAAQTFDWVIFDSPPLAGLADADVLASKLDGVIFIVRAFQTPATLFQKTMETLRTKNVLGIVFNGDEDEDAGKYAVYYRHEDNRV
jgi:protein-tyrosine kinase